MTPRQQRRALERKTRKAAERQPQTPVQPSFKASKPSYEAAVASASLSVLLPSEDPDAYRHHLESFYLHHAPAAGIETEIVRRLADLQWRIKRIAVLEAGILALGRRKYADQIAESNPAVRDALLDAHTLVVDGLPLKRLHLQESQLRRFYKNDLAELKTLQENRDSAQPEAASKEIASKEIAANGFVFSDFDPALCLESAFGPELGLNFHPADHGSPAAASDLALMR